MRFELFIAARYLRAKRRQAVIGVITAISIIGVAAGVASLIVALAINNGFREDMQQRLLGSTSHVNLMRTENDGIHDYSALQQRLEKLPHVQAAAPAIYEQVLISRGARAGGAVLKGIVPADERRVTALLDTVHDGSTQPLTDAQQPSTATPPEPSAQDSNPSSLEGAADRIAAMPPIVLGKDLATTLGASVGSVVLVTSPQGELTPFGMVPRYMRFKVAGIFQSGFYDYDSTWALCSLADSQRLFSLGDIASVLEFKVDNIYNAGTIGNQIEAAAGKGFQTTNWMDQNRALFRALRLERVVTFITIGLIVFVAALNILISLIMMVMEKTRDIAVLVSMGARREQVRRIFIWQGLLIGIIGTALGVIIGYTVAILAGHYHWITLSAEVYAIDYVPFVPRAIDAALVAIVSLAISFIATVYPSQSAARVLPAEALRYE
ncbi:MAG TPA: FtsX-like permease family protein [Candidatus Saccharimonadales bacterium]|nr:FtsX-like permease family protein [Candidatus Saccharimonadales bacterium]